MYFARSWRAVRDTGAAYNGESAWTEAERRKLEKNAFKHGEILLYF